MEKVLMTIKDLGKLIIAWKHKRAFLNGNRNGRISEMNSFVAKGSSFYKRTEFDLQIDSDNYSMPKKESFFRCLKFQKQINQINQPHLTNIQQTIQYTTTPDIM